MSGNLAAVAPRRRSAKLHLVADTPELFRAISADRSGDVATYYFLATFAKGPKLA